MLRLKKKLVSLLVLVVVETGYADSVGLAEQVEVNEVECFHRVPAVNDASAIGVLSDLSTHDLLQKRGS